MAELIHAQSIVAGRAEGKALVSQVPLSLWGGYDQETGEIIDRRHPLSGQLAAGRVLVLPHSRGSSTTTAVLLEALRVGKAPAAIVTTVHDAFFALAGIVAEEMYGSGLPILAIEHKDFKRIKTGQMARVDLDGTISIDE